MIYNYAGDVMQTDDEQQADICEFIRSVIAEEKIPETGEFDELRHDWVTKINCAGFP